MNDTHPKIAHKIKQMMKQRSGVERLVMGFNMCQMARELVIQSLKAAGMTDSTLKHALFLRLYPNLLDQTHKEQFFNMIAK